MSKIPQSITVELNRKDGWWYATSNDLKGLLVANPALTEFSKEIPEVIKALLKVKYGVEVCVREITSPDSSDMRHVTFMAEKKAA